jgi:hypothetical protein
MRSDLNLQPRPKKFPLVVSAQHTHTWTHLWGTFLSEVETHKASGMFSGQYLFYHAQSWWNHTETFLWLKSLTNMLKTKTDLGSFLEKALLIFTLCSGQNIKLTLGESSLLANTKVLKERSFCCWKRGTRVWQTLRVKSLPAPNSEIYPLCGASSRMHNAVKYV